MLRYKILDSHAYDNLHFHLLVYDVPASGGKSTCQTTRFHKIEYCNFDIFFFLLQGVYIYRKIEI
jgi:hypothetical protein